MKVNSKRLRKTAVVVVRQGAHKERIIAYYRILLRAAQEEFTEDNDATLRDFLEECHRESFSHTAEA